MFNYKINVNEIFPQLLLFSILNSIHDPGDPDFPENQIIKVKSSRPELTLG